MPVKTEPKTNTAQKVLIVEDEGELRLILDIILHERNLDLTYVSNLLDAEEYLKANQPSLVILDNKLPDGYGVDFISYIRKHYPGTKIIMVSGLGSAKDVALENGADLFLEKPFALDEFNKVMDEYLG